VQPLDDLAAVLAADGAARTRVAARIGEASA
jgi:hypothetical protein